MVQITELNEEVIQSVPHVLELLFEIYGPKTIGLYAVNVDGELGFIGRDGANCVYIHKNGYNRFTLNQDEELGVLLKDGMEIYFGDSLYFVDENKHEHSVELYSLDRPDDEEYDGCVSYKQYNPNNDTLCEMRFQHMYREVDGRPIIYGYHTQKVDCLYIDEEYTKRPQPKKGILPKRAKYYSKLEFDEDMIGYKWVALKEFGLSEFLAKGSYQLQREHKVVRYTKTRFISMSGNYCDFWPIGEQLKIEDLNELIGSYDFNTELPWKFLEVYNGRDSFVNTLKEIVAQMKSVTAEIRNAEETDKCAILRLRTE